MLVILYLQIVCVSQNGMYWHDGALLDCTEMVCQVWYWTIKNKYDLVGKLSGYDPKSTEM